MSRHGFVKLMMHVKNSLNLRRRCHSREHLQNIKEQKLRESFIIIIIHSTHCFCDNNNNRFFLDCRLNLSSKITYSSKPYSHVIGWAVNGMLFFLCFLTFVTNIYTCFVYPFIHVLWLLSTPIIPSSSYLYIYILLVFYFYTYFPCPTFSFFCTFVCVSFGWWTSILTYIRVGIRTPNPKDIIIEIVTYNKLVHHIHFHRRWLIFQYKKLLP